MKNVSQYCQESPARLILHSRLRRQVDREELVLLEKLAVNRAKLDSVGSPTGLACSNDGI